MMNYNRTGIKKRIQTAVISGLYLMLVLFAASCSLDPASLIPGQGQNSAVTQQQEILIPAFKVVNVFDVSQTEGRELPTIGVDELSVSPRSVLPLRQKVRETEAAAVKDKLVAALMSDEITL